MASREHSWTTIRLLPTDVQRAALDGTWARCGRLMNIVNDCIVRTDAFAHTVVGSTVVDRLLATENGKTMPSQIFDGCIRTVSRHCMAHQDDVEGNRIDWTNAPEQVELSITGKVVTILRGGVVLIQTATGRERMPFELIEGNPAVLREAYWLFHWLRNDAGEHLIQYRQGELKAGYQRSR